MMHCQKNIKLSDHLAIDIHCSCTVYIPNVYLIMLHSDVGTLFIKTVEFPMLFFLHI